MARRCAKSCMCHGLVVSSGRLQMQDLKMQDRKLQNMKKQDNARCKCKVTEGIENKSTSDSESRTKCHGQNVPVKCHGGCIAK